MKLAEQLHDLPSFLKTLYSDTNDYYLDKIGINTLDGFFIFAAKKHLRGFVNVLRRYNQITQKVTLDDLIEFFENTPQVESRVVYYSGNRCKGYLVNGMFIDGVKGIVNQTQHVSDTKLIGTTQVKKTTHNPFTLTDNVIDYYPIPGSLVALSINGLKLNLTSHAFKQFVSRRAYRRKTSNNNKLRNLIKILLSAERYTKIVNRQYPRIRKSSDFYLLSGTWCFVVTQSDSAIVTCYRIDKDEKRRRYKKVKKEESA